MGEVTHAVSKGRLGQRPLEQEPPRREQRQRAARLLRHVELLFELGLEVATTTWSRSPRSRSIVVVIIEVAVVERVVERRVAVDVEEARDHVAREVPDGRGRVARNGAVRDRGGLAVSERGMVRGPGPAVNAVSASPIFRRCT